MVMAAGVVRQSRPGLNQEKLPCYRRSSLSQVVIENPIINSPFDEPTRHFRFDDEGITSEEVIGRRVSHYFVPIARSKTRNRRARTGMSYARNPTNSRQSGRQYSF